MKIKQKYGIFQAISRSGMAGLALLVTAIFSLSLAGCNTLQSVEVSGQPVRTVYGQGQEFDPAGLTATEHYKKGNAETIGANALRISGYDKDKPGEQTVTVSYEKDGQRNSTTFTVKVAPISKIALVSAPDKTEYFVGEGLNLTGIRVNGIWEGIGEEPLQITAGNISGFDTKRPGKQTLTVSSQGQTTNFSVTVAALQSIAITAPPSKTNYEFGEDLNLGGMKVQGTRQGASSPEALNISGGMISGYDKLKAGSQRVTITVGGASASFTVTVASNPLVGTWRGTSTHRYTKTAAEGGGGG
ncbi:MAG: bacterial Ig-like domain-containing protein [Spirochaetaceae bacterium]|jgi:predicted small secreted protein|nr:bacterial Ig-like domain-containing protein [Spirochaetaceae bacterium]